MLCDSTCSGSSAVCSMSSSTEETAAFMSTQRRSGDLRPWTNTIWSAWLMLISYGEGVARPYSSYFYFLDMTCWGSLIECEIKTPSPSAMEHPLHERTWHVFVLTPTQTFLVNEWLYDYITTFSHPSTSGHIPLMLCRRRRTSLVSVSVAVDVNISTSIYNEYRSRWWTGT